MSPEPIREPSDDDGCSPTPSQAQHNWLKVTGRAQFSADLVVANPFHAWILLSFISKGQTVSLNTAKARGLLASSISRCMRTPPNSQQQSARRRAPRRAINPCPGENAIAQQAHQERIPSNAAVASIWSRRRIYRQGPRRLRNSCRVIFGAAEVDLARPTMMSASRPPANLSKWCVGRFGRRLGRARAPRRLLYKELDSVCRVAAGTVANRRLVAVDVDLLDFEDGSAADDLQQPCLALGR